MKCFCGGNTKVLITEARADGSIFRRRQCLKCGVFIITHERAEDVYADPRPPGRPGPAPVKKSEPRAPEKPVPKKKAAAKKPKQPPKRGTAPGPKKQAVKPEGWKESGKTVRGLETPANLKDYDRLPLDDPIFDEDPFEGGIGEGV
jgi:hypothetical protein